MRKGPDPAGLERITPSNIKPDYWTGTKVPGDELTKEQRATLETCERDEGRSLTIVEHGVRFEGRGHWDPITFVRFRCPLIVETRLALKLITPSGEIAWVQKPKKRSSKWSPN